MMIRSTVQHAGGHENTERWLLTYADMITLLTAFFLLLYSMSVMSKGKFAQIATSVRSGFHSVTPDGAGIAGNSMGRGETGDPTRQYATYQKQQNAMTNLRGYVEQHNLKGKVRTRADERGVVISLLSDDMMFARGKADLAPESVETLQKVAQIIQASSNNVQIEGHTDDLPIRTTQFPSNWELSSARAGAVLRWFTDRAGIAGKRFVVSGYADTRPVAPNTSEAGRTQNRRVDIILLKSDAQREREWRRRDETRRILTEQGSEGNEKGIEGNGGGIEANSNTTHPSSLIPHPSRSGPDETTLEP